VHYHVRSGERGVSIEMNAKTAAENTGPAIQFQDVTYSLGGSVPRTIVNGVSFSVASGQTLVLLGRSGSGKTTLLKLINGLLVPSAGQVIVCGRPTTDWDPIRLRRGIGYVIQDAGLFPHFTAAQNIALVPSLEKWDAARTTARVNELLSLVGLEPAQYCNRRPHELSGGQRQRVGVARALAAEPRILLMDEPFGALDPVTRAELQREFSALARRLGKTIVLVTHDLREALLLASRIILLENGRAITDCSPQEFPRIDHPEVRAFTDCLTPLPGASA
jgi:osmoprotectant transport system ATP-binding protein